MADDPEGPRVPFEETIIISWATDEERVVYDIGDCDWWSACTVLKQVLGHISAHLPQPRCANDIEEED